MGAVAYVRDAEGVPIPPSDLVAELQKRCDSAQVGLRYCNASWQLIWTWKPDDPRRQWIKEGKYSERDAFDIIGDLPPDCSLEQAPSYAERSLRQYPRDEVRKLADNIQRYNEVTVPKEQVASIIEEVLGGNALDAVVGKSENRVSVAADIGQAGRKGIITKVKGFIGGQK